MKEPRKRSSTWWVLLAIALAAFVILFGAPFACAFLEFPKALPLT